MTSRPSLVSLLLCCALLAPALAAGQAPAQKPDLGDELRRAASAGDAAKVRELLAAGADPNAANAYGGTPLSFASDKGHAEVVKLLLDKGANPNVKDRFYNQTPLAWAVSNGHAEAARALLAKGAEGEAEALAMAAASGKPEIVQVIVERGKVPPAALSDALAAAEAQPDGEGKAVAELLRKAGVQPPPAVEVDPAVLQSYAGVYEPEDASFKLNVVFADGKLRVEGGGGPPLTLAAVDTTHFRAVEFPGFKVAFDVADGKVKGATADAGGRVFQLRKTDAQEGTKP